MFLHAQCHDRVDNVVVVLLQSLDSLFPRHTRLLHHKLNVLALQTSLIDLLAIILFLLFFFLSFSSVNGLALAVVVAGMLSSFSSGELLGGSGLRLGVEVLDLGFAEDAMECSAFLFVKK